MQAAALRGSQDTLAARAERFKGTSAAEDAAAQAAEAAAARPFAPFAGAGRSKLCVVNKSDTMRRFYVRLLKSGSVRQYEHYYTAVIWYRWSSVALLVSTRVCFTCMVEY